MENEQKSKQITSEKIHSYEITHENKLKLKMSKQKP